MTEKNGQQFSSRVVQRTRSKKVKLLGTFLKSQMNRN